MRKKNRNRRTILGVEHRDVQGFHIPQLLVLQILLVQLVHRIPQVLAVVRNTDSQETNVKDRLALRERRLALIDAIRGLHLPQAGDETVKSTRGTGDDESLRAIVKGNVQLRVRWEVLVCLRDVRLEILEQQTDDRQHGRGRALATLDRILHDARLECENRKGLLASKTGMEEPPESLVQVLEVTRVVGRCGNANGGNETLRVARSTHESRVEFCVRQSRDA